MKRTTQVQRPPANATPPLCDLSKMLIGHLRRIGGFHDSVATVDHAVEKLFTLEAEAFSSLMGNDDIYPSAMIAFGAEFVARAFDVLVCNPPRAARNALLKLLDEIRSEMRERVTFALDEGTIATA
jgi:hypothetical protein